MKKFLIILFVVILIFLGGIAYLNQAVFPTKMKAAIVAGIEDATGKKVLLGSVRFDLLKGLVLKDLIISDDQNAIVNVKEARASFLIIPLFSRQIIVSRLILESPDIFVERREDNSFNIIELFPKAGPAAGAGLKTFVHRVSLRNGSVTFHDLTMEPLYTKDIKVEKAEIYFRLPAKIKFSAIFSIPTDRSFKCDMTGEYALSSGSLDVEARIKALAPEEFAVYYKNTGFSFPEGRIDADIGLKYKDGVILAQTDASAAKLSILQAKTSITVTGSEHSNIRYVFTDKKFDFTGSANIEDMMINGVDYIESVDSVKGRVAFSNLGISSDNITAVVLDMPIEAKVSVNDLKAPVIKIDASSDVELSNFQGVLKESFSIDIPAGLEGEGKLHVSIEYPPATPEKTQVSGFVYMLNASARINEEGGEIDNLTGKFNFSSNQLIWDDIGFRYHDTYYKSSGVLTNFDSPGIQLKLSSEDLSVDAVFALRDRAINFSKLSGKYLNSSVSAAGVLFTSDMPVMNVEMTGRLNVDLEDLKGQFKKSPEKFEKIKPKGVIRAEFKLKGNLKDLKKCDIEAALSSEELSLYGLHFTNSTMNYAQMSGEGQILFMRSFLYGGSMAATGKIMWLGKDVPYGLDVNIDGVRIEKFKSDTAMKDKDIAGAVKLQARLKGLFGDIGKLSGNGRMAVTEGRLWQLNLFRGIGTMLFTSDFSNIIFKEGRCDFTISDKTVYTDEIMLKSDVLDIYGPITIGFDNSVSAELKADFSEDALESGARKNIAAAIGQYSIIGLSGTLKEPQYKLKADVANIMEDLADRFAQE